MEVCGLYVDYSGTMNECEVKIGNSEYTNLRVFAVKERRNGKPAAIAWL